MKPNHPLDRTRFSNIPEEIAPEEARRRFRESVHELLRQLADPDYYRQMARPRPWPPNP